MARWKAGNLTLQDEQVARGQIEAWETLLKLEVQYIREFYGVTVANGSAQ